MSCLGPSPQKPLANGVRRTKVVATVGPASHGEETLTALLQAGVDVVRLNFSHGTREEHGQSMDLVRAIAQRLGRPIAILQDLQGPKIRTGPLVDGQPVYLANGAEVTITSETVPGTTQLISTTYPRLAADVRPGDRILLNDGRIELRVLAASGTLVRAQVLHGGTLGERKGMNLPGIPLSTPSLTAKDEEDLAFGVDRGVDYIALSFVREAQDVHRARDLLGRRGADIPLIAKLEKPEAIDHLDEILAASDGVMIARGDLGVEMPPEQVPLLQKAIIRQANEWGLPVITATQMLESMVTSPQPTRAEASDVANAVIDGSDALMLSGETAIGAYPVAAVEAMVRIILAAEGQLPPPKLTESRGPAHAIAHAARTLAEHLDVRAIAAFTRTGRTARLLSQVRPRAPIVAFTPDERVYRRLALCWGVMPVLSPFQEHTDAMIDYAEERLLEMGWAKEGDLVIMVGASPLRVGTHTNFVKLHTVGQ
ncbi:MAG: pyruvate kinase [Dehalococcoidia bacterium]